MRCTRLDHFVKIRPFTPSISRCCIMVNRPSFNTLEEMEQSEWLANVKAKFANNEWPNECRACRDKEVAGIKSVRQIEERLHDRLKLVNEKYLIVDVTVDTICNAACQICSSAFSSTYAKTFKLELNKFSGLLQFNSLPQERIVQVDVLGGEPGVSKDSKQLLLDLANNSHNLQRIRINTNGSVRIPEVELLLERGIDVDMCFSMDGTKKVFEYCRWPIKWNTFKSNITYYADLRSKYSTLYVNTWSAFSAFCIGDVPNIIDLKKEIGIPQTSIMSSGASIIYPQVLAIQRTNFLTFNAKNILAGTPLANMIATDEHDNTEKLCRFIKQNDAARDIFFTNYF